MSIVMSADDLIRTIGGLYCQLDANNRLLAQARAELAPLKTQLEQQTIELANAQAEQGRSATALTQAQERIAELEHQLDETIANPHTQVQGASEASGDNATPGTEGSAS